MNNNSSHPVITQNNKCLNNSKGKGNVNVTNISLQSMFKMSTSCFNACLKPFAKWQYCFISWALWQVRPDRVQDGLQLRNVRWLRYIALILVKHRTPHMIVKRVEIRRIRWPLWINSGQFRLSQSCASNAVWAVAKLSFFSSDSCNFCFMWMIWKKFSENTVVFLSIIWCKNSGI